MKIFRKMCIPVTLPLQTFQCKRRHRIKKRFGKHYLKLMINFEFKEIQKHVNKIKKYSAKSAVISSPGWCVGQKHIFM